jgi:hypothetical protein
MAHEATKHLWDLRTASDPDPRFPAEVGAASAADVIDEFGDVFMAEARRRGIHPLDGAVALVASDTDVGWILSPEWRLERMPPVAADRAAEGAADATITAELGDLVLLVWERADLDAGPVRFRVDGDASLAAAFRSTPVHL